MFSIDATNGREGQYNAVRAVWALVGRTRAGTPRPGKATLFPTLYLTIYTIFLIYFFPE